MKTMNVIKNSVMVLVFIVTSVPVYTVRLVCLGN